MEVRERIKKFRRELKEGNQIRIENKHDRRILTTALDLYEVNLLLRHSLFGQGNGNKKRIKKQRGWFYGIKRGSKRKS